MILFDFSYFCHRIIHPSKEKIIENPHFFSHLIMTQILQYIKKFGASKQNKMVLCLDSKVSWRHTYYLEHKPNTPDYIGKTYKGDRVKDTTIPWDTIYDAMDNVCGALRDCSDLFVVKVDNAEADDIIAVLSKRFCKDETVWVLSPDKDFVQLQIQNKVAVYDPLKGAFKPEQDIALFKTIHNIIGDKADSILAIKPRTQEATAIKMLKDLNELLQTNVEMRTKFDFNKTLIDFDHIPKEIENDILGEFYKQEHNYNMTGLMKMFMKYKLSEHAQNITSFKLPDLPYATKLNQYFVTYQKNVEVSRGNLLDFFD
jgi:hypothetical protein